LDIASGIPTSWNPSVDYRGLFPGVVNALTEKGGTIYLGGLFTGVAGQERKGLAAVDAATGLATAWNPSPSFTEPFVDAGVSALAVSGQTVYAGGIFDHVGGQGRNGLAALDVKTGIANGWDPAPTGFGSDHGCALLVRGNTVFAGGAFLWTSGSLQSGLAAIEAVHGKSEGNKPSEDQLVTSPLDANAAMSVLDRGREVVISYSLPEQGPARIAVFDVAGRRVATLGHDVQGAGTHQLDWDSSGLAAGLYLYRLEAGRARVTKTVLHLR
jgi:hypothetical protein